MIPSSVVQTERLRQGGIDLLRDHRDDLPAELIYYLEEGRRSTVLGSIHDQEVRTEVYDAIEAVFQSYDLLLGPTLACPPVDNATDGNTLGPQSINGEAINRLIGFCPTFRGWKIDLPMLLSSLDVGRLLRY